MRRRRLFTSRYVILTLIFCVALAIFAARLFNIQIIQSDKYESSYPYGSNVRKVIVKANRGEIFDRNGKKLVENSPSYDLYLDAYGFSDDAKKNSRDMLAVLSMVEESGLSSSRTDKFFPFEGEYPNLSYTDAALSEGSDDRYYLTKMLGYIGKKESISAKDLVVYFVDRYSLDAKNPDGTFMFTNAEITELLRLRMNMTLKQFSEYNPYLLVASTPEYFPTYVKETGLRCINFVCENERVYKYPGYASHILGRTGPIFAENWEYYNALGYEMSAIVGLDGCEEAFEEYLRGSDGIMVIVEDKDGNVIESYYEKEPVAGKDVWLTIDIDVQIAAEDGLKNNVEYIRNNFLNETCDSGAIVALDPNTGEVLAIGSYPTYDLTTFSESFTALNESASKPLLNRALKGTYAPGSVFKIAMSAIGLTEQVIAPHTIIECEGKYTYYPGYQPRCWIYNSNGSFNGYYRMHGPITVREAIQDSCNCFYYDLGRRLGIERMNNYSKVFGLGMSTGIEIGESTGILAGNAFRDENGYAPWEPGDTIAAAIGQSDNSFTPIQMATMISTISNGGTRYSTHLLKYVKEFGKDEPFIQKEPEAITSFPLDAEDRDVILDAMRNVVLTHSFIDNQMKKVSVKVGGKTGTAQVSSGIENGLFAGVAPYDDPEIVVVCVIEHASGGTYASMAAAETFKAYFDKK